MKLELGNASRILKGWIGLDMQVRPGVLTMKMPEGLRRFGDNTVRYIYTSHFLEHLEYPKDAVLLVEECYRILSPRGVLRIVVPGIEKIIRAYVEDDRGFFKIQAELHPHWCTTKLEHLMYALQQDGEHQYGYDFETMTKLLSQAGFETIIQSDYNKSQFKEFRIDYGNPIDNHTRYLSLFVEAVKHD